MTRPATLVVGFGVWCILPALALFPAYSAMAAEAAMEEIVVTGSYLKRSAADSPSPLSVIDRAAIEVINPTDMKDIIQALTYNSGSLGAGSNVYDGGDASTGTASINLRNLGNGSTLVLVNGKRMVLSNYDLANNGYTDIAGMMPNIAVERIEVVKDGSSALYGSDAIAGVVNFITRSDFEGFDLAVTYQTDHETTSQSDKFVEGLLGVQNDRGGIVLAMSYLDRAGLQAGDRFDDFGRSGLSTNGQPGRFIPIGPTFAPDGVTPALFGGEADLDCNLLVQPDFKGTQGTLGPNLCVYDFSSFFNFVEEGEATKVSINGHYLLSDNVELYTDAFFSNNLYSRGNSLFPSTIPPTIPANNPGVINDAARRGIAPQSVTARWRLLGGSTDTPFAQRPVNTDTDAERTFLRMTGGLNMDFVVGDKDWTADFSVTRSYRQTSGNTRSDAMTQPTNLAFSGLGGTQCDVVNGQPGSGNLRLAGQPFTDNGQCFYLNPFASAYIKPDGTPQDDPLLMNPAELLESLVGDLTARRYNNMLAVDLVFAGDLFDMANGPVGLAVGGQWRKEEVEVDNDRIRNNNGVLFAFGEPDWGAQLTTIAAFVEISIPVLENLDINVAARFEDFDEIDENTFDPKLTILYRPIDSLALRASAGTSYRVPSLLQAFGFNTSLLNTSDPLDPSGVGLFIPAITQGNPQLTPEDAFTFNLGFSWAPLDGALEGLAVDFDYYNYDYEDIITRQSADVLVGSDLAARCPNGLSVVVPLCGFQPDGSFATINPGNPQVIRDPTTGILLRTLVLSDNAQSLDTSGIDLDVRYSFDWPDIGFISLQLIGSWTLTYDLVDPDGQKIDGIGSRNLLNSVGHPLPEFRLRGSLGWTRDIHAATVTVNYIDGYKDDSTATGLYGFNAIYTGAHPNIDSFTTVDVQYNVQIPAMGFLGEGSAVTLGLKNAFNETPPRTTKNGLYDPFTHDPRGRMYYATYRLSL